MTIICAMASKDGNDVAFSADRALSYGDHIEAHHTSKWQNIDGVWLGCSGLHLISCALAEIPSREFIKASTGSTSSLRRLLVDAAVAGGAEKGEGGNFNSSGIIIIPGYGMWTFSGDFLPMPVKAGTFAAVGSGLEYAYGAAHALSHSGDEQPAQIVLKAALAAAAYNVSCSRPIDVYQIGADMKVVHHECA